MSAVTTFVVVVDNLDPTAVVNLDEIKKIFLTLKIVRPTGSVEVKIILGTLEELIARNSRPRHLPTRRPGKQKEINELKRVLADAREVDHG